MTRNLLWVAGGALGVLVVAGLCGLVFLKTASTGFSARSAPSFLEAMAARQARSLAMPALAKNRENPLPKTKKILDEAMAHWADHCAVCHANDGSGAVEMGRQMYPQAPDMRREETQKLTDGELFYMIENGIRLSGMPAWGGSPVTEKDSWKLVHFIRHLPHLSPSETAQMEKLNPRGPEDKEQEQQEEQFLNGPTTKEK